MPQNLTDMFCLVDLGVIVRNPQHLPRRFNGIASFNELTNAQVATHGWYYVNPFSFNQETEKLDDPVINHTAHTVTYPVLQKTTNEIDQYHAEQKAWKIQVVWQAAHDYEYAQISGTAIGMLTALVLNLNIKGVEVQGWCKSIWDLYYERKAAIEADWTATANTDFSSCGDIPHTIPALMVEYEALLGG